MVVSFDLNPSLCQHQNRHCLQHQGANTRSVPCLALRVSPRSKRACLLASYTSSTAVHTHIPASPCFAALSRPPALPPLQVMALYRPLCR